MGFRLKFLSPVLVLALLLNVVPALRATAALADVSGASITNDASDEFAAYDFVSALAKARALNHRILLVPALSEESTTWVNVDGTSTVDVSGSPVRVRDDAGKFGWRDLDFDLVATVDGVVAKSGLLPLTLSPGGTAAQVAVTGLVSAMNSDGVRVGFGWVGALPTPVLLGDKATYVDVLPGVDLVVSLTANGFEQFFVLKQKPSRAVLDALKLPLQSTHVTVVEGVYGFDFVNSAGVNQASISAVQVWDSSAGAGAGAGVDVTVPPLGVQNMDSSVTGSAGRYVLDLVTDDSFFDAAGLVYPVVIDPTVSFGSSFDTYVQSDAASSDFSNSTELLVGTPNSGGSRYRSFLNFGSTAWSKTHIVSATLKLWLSYSYSCTPSTLNIHASQAANSSTRWGNQPTVEASLYSSVSAAAGYSSACVAATQNFDVTDPATFLASQNMSTVGFELRASEVNNTGFKRFYSSNATTHKPQLSVTYNNPPQTPVQVNVTNSRNVNGSVVVPAANPTFTSSATDVDFDDVSVSFYYNDYSLSATNPVKTLLCTSSAVASDAQASCQSTKTLNNNETYTVWAVAADKYDTSSNSVSTTFKIDTSIPLPPVISCPDYPNNFSTTVVPGTNFNCTVTPNSASKASTLTITVNGDTSSYNETTNEPVTLMLKASNIQHNLSAYTTLSNGLISDNASYVLTFGTVGVISPTKPVKTFNNVSLNAFATPQAGAISNSYLKWRVFGDVSWVQDPTSLPVTTQNSVKAVVDYPWDSTTAKVTAAGVVLKPEQTVLLQVQICFVYDYPTNSTSCTGSSGIQVLRLGHAFGGNLPTTDAGPATVSLLSGEIQLSENDVNITTPAGSFNSDRVYYSQKLATTTNNDGFGTGWLNSFTATDTGLSDVSIIDGITKPISGTDQTVKVQDQLGEVLTYQKSGSSYTPTDDQTELSGLQLNISTDALTLTLKDAGGTTTTFTNTTPTTTPTWVVSGVNETGSLFQTCYQNGADGLTKLIQKLQTNTTPCSTLLAGNSLTADVRTMTITYATTTTASNNATSTSNTTGLGDVQHLIKNINYTAYNPTTQTQTTTLQSSYQYQQLNGQPVLITATDNRDNTTTTYTYKTINTGTTQNPNNWPQLTQIKQTGFAPYTFEYAADNKLTHTLRGNADGSSGTVIENSFVYNTPTGSLASSAPNLSLTNVNKWGQSKAPTFSAIIFGPQTPIQTPTNNTPIDANTLNSAQLKTGSYIYTDTLGRVTNTASFGHDSWLYSATIFNNQGLPQAIFAPRDLNRLLTDIQTTPHLNPQDYATLNRYSKPTTAAGNVNLLDSWSPTINQTITTQSDETLAGSWRIHTTNIYDTGAPNQNINPVTNKNYGMLTAQTNGWVSSEEVNLDSAATLPTDIAPISSVTNTYDPQNVVNSPIDSSGSGWFYGTPTRVETKDKNGATTSIGITYLNASGQATQTKGPLSTDNEAVDDTARSLYTVYYTAGFNAVTDCQNKPAWVGLVCKQSTAPPNTPTVHPVTTITAYTTDLQPQTVVESANLPGGAQSRTTQNSYTTTGQINTTNITSSGLTDNTAISTQISYQSNGLAYQTTKTVSGVASNTHLSFDSWGRQTSFTNSLGESAYTTYKPYGDAGSGLIATYQDPQNTIGYQYGGTDANGQTETRPQVTSMNIGGDTYQAAYDNFGAITKQKAPNGLTQSFVYDDQGRLTGMNYGGTTTDTLGNPVEQSWYNFARTFNENSQLAIENKPTSGVDSANATSTYNYDTKNRLTSATTVNDAGTACTTSSYTFDIVGNRTQKISSSGTSSNCATTTQTKTTRYNAYSQITDTGYVYDGFGRNTFIPAANTPTGASDLTLSYNIVGQVTAINGVTAGSYTYDPNGNNLTETTSTAGVTTTTTKHYFGSDTPSFTTSTTSGVVTTEKYGASLGSGLNSVTTTVNGVTTTNYVFTDLQGANFATTTKPATGNATPPAGINTYDEFGNQTSNTQSIGTNQNYGWAGSAHRTTDKNGLILLGARVYNPTTGQFTTTDPVPGGNENAYNYPNNPVNQNDFTGCSGFDWGMALDIGLTVAMIAIDCVPVVGEVAMAAEAGYAIYRASRVARAIEEVAIKTIGPATSKMALRRATRVLEKNGYKALTRKEIEEQGITSYVYHVPSGYRAYIGRTTQGLKRMAQHAKNPSSRITSKGTEKGVYIDTSKMSLEEQRNLEQTLINQNGGLKKLANKINSVDSKYWDARKIAGVR